MTTHQMIHRHQSRVPPGFRFHPTDEELVGYYLHKKVSSRRIDLDVIREIDLYKMEPWDLQEKCRIGSAEQNEWYFFSHKDKKYPTGTRTNRATTAGFWKATGRDKTIHTKYSFIGMRKTLVFYKGRAPNGQKTDWIMHEYRLEDEQSANGNHNYNNDQDGWVVCRVFKKKINLKGQKADSSPTYDVEESSIAQQEFSGTNTNNTGGNNAAGNADNNNNNNNNGSNMSNNNPNNSTSTANYLMRDPIVPSFQIFSCKQELSRLDEFSPSYADPFRLPQLESPKLGATLAPPSFPARGMFSMKGSASSSFDGNCSNSSSSNMIMRHNYPPPAFGLDAAEFHDKELGEEHLVTDWRAVDKLAAAHLSQDQQTLLKDSTRYCVENDDYAGDVALLLRLSKQDMENVGCGDGGELWNFGRDSTL